MQARERLGAIHFQAAVLLRLDDDDARARDAVVAPAQQPILLDNRGQPIAPR